MGLRYALLALPNIDPVQLLVDNFFTNRAQLKDMTDVVAVKFSSKVFHLHKDDIDKFNATIADFFLFMVEIITGEIDVAHQLSNTIFESSYRDYYYKLEPVQEEDRFYQEALSAAMVFCASALCPLPMEVLFKTLKSLLSDPYSKQKLFSQLLELDPVTHTWKLNSMVQKTLDLNTLDDCIFYDEGQLHSAIIEGWEEKFGKVQRNPYAIPRTYSNIPQLLKVLFIKDNVFKYVLQLTENTEWLSSSSNKDSVRFFLRFVLLLIESMPQAARKDLPPQIHALIEKMKTVVPGGHPLMNSFIRVAQHLINPNGTDLLLDSTAEEVADLENKEKQRSHYIKQRFEKIKSAQIKRMKRLQQMCMNFNVGNQDANTMEESKAAPISLSGELPVCATTKETLDPDSDHFILANIHVTNIIPMSEIIALSRLKLDENKSEDGEILSHLFMLKELAQSRLCPVFTSCGHRIKEGVNIPLSGYIIYDRANKPCPLCKRACSLLVPVLGHKSLEILKNIKPAIEEEISAANLIKNIVVTNATVLNNSNFFKASPILDQYLQKELGKLAHKLENCLGMLGNVYMNYHNLRSHILSQAPNPKEAGDLTGNVENSYSTIFKLANLKRFDELIKSYGETYHHFFILMRAYNAILKLKQIDLTEEIDLLKNSLTKAFGAVEEAELAKANFVHLFVEAVNKLNSFIVCKSLHANLIRELASLFASLQFKQFLVQNKLSQSSKWEDVKYQENLREKLEQHMLQFLRPAMLMHIIYNYPEMQNNKQVARIIESNSKGNHKELEQILTYLNIKIDQTQLPSFDLTLPEISNEEAMDAQTREYMRERGISPQLSLLRVPTNFMDLHNEYFWKKCTTCNKPGFLTLCLVCGDAVCRKSCEIETPDGKRSFLT